MNYNVKSLWLSVLQYAEWITPNQHWFCCSIGVHTQWTNDKWMSIFDSTILFTYLSGTGKANDAILSQLSIIFEILGVIVWFKDRKTIVTVKPLWSILASSPLFWYTVNTLVQILSTILFVLELLLLQGSKNSYRSSSYNLVQKRPGLAHSGCSPLPITS